MATGIYLIQFLQLPIFLVITGLLSIATKSTSFELIHWLIVSITMLIYQVDPVIFAHEDDLSLSNRKFWINLKLHWFTIAFWGGLVLFLSLSIPNLIPKIKNPGLFLAIICTISYYIGRKGGISFLRPVFLAIAWFSTTVLAFSKDLLPMHILLFIILWQNTTWFSFRDRFSDPKTGKINPYTKVKRKVFLKQQKIAFVIILIFSLYWIDFLFTNLKTAISTFSWIFLSLWYSFGINFFEEKHSFRKDAFYGWFLDFPLAIASWIVV